MEWLKTAQEVGQLGVTGLLGLIAYVQWKQNTALLVQLVTSKDDLARAKGDAAKDMIAFLKEAREAGLVRPLRSLTPSGTRIPE